MNILYIITGLGMGGAETQVCRLADSMVSRDNNVTVIYLFGEKVISPNNKKIKVIGLGLENNIFSFIRTILRLVRQIKIASPDIVHSHMFHANIISRICRLFVNMPVLISSAHSSNEGGRFRMYLYRLTQSLSNLTTNVGQLSVDRYIRVGASTKDGIISMLNGIDTNYFHPSQDYNLLDQLNINEGERVFLSVGRNVPEKDYPNLLNALSLIHKSYNFRFLIVGLDTELLMPQVRSLQLEDKVQLLGLRSDIREIMSLSDTLVMSSCIEGLPVVIGEAMACCCNIITTDAGGCREWLTSSDSVVPIKNSLLLAKAIESNLALTNDELTKIGVSNRQHIISNFSLDTISNSWLRIYKNLLD